MASQRNGRYDINDDYEDEREAARRRLERRRAASGSQPASSRRQAPSSSERSRARARDDERIDPLSRSLVGAPASVLSDGVHIPRPVIFGAGILLLVAIFAGIAAIERACTVQDEPPAAIQVDTGDGTAASEEQPAAQADFSLLPADTPADIVSALEAKADDQRVVSIVNNAQGYVDAFGAVSAANMFKLAAEDDEALDFVAGVLDEYPEASGSPIDESVTKGVIPMFYQWDTRWGYVDYCAGPIGTTGCCPTSLSMVYAGLTGKTDKSPADFAAISTENGYAEDGQGTYATFLTDMSATFGLQCEKFTPTTQNFLTYLESGYVVICNVGPGDFTDSGHFFVATGLADDGTVKVNDPYSSVRSAKTWDPERIANQSIGMYAFRA